MDRSVAPLLVLASQSPSRVNILRSSGIGFSQLVSGVDEDAAVAAREAERGRGLSPGEKALVLARAKAEAVAALPETAGRLVLGCDSVFELDGAAYGKPRTPETARERLREMSGRTGTLHTGHWLVDRRGTPGTDDAAAPESAAEHADAPAEKSGAGRFHDAAPAQGAGHGSGLLRSATVDFARMSLPEIEAYAATGEPLWVAGSFTLEGYGAAFITGIRGESHTVLGLSVNGLRELLAGIGLEITDLWVPDA